MMMSASPGRGGGDGATYGVDRSTMANSQALTWCAWLRSRRLRLRKISGIWSRYSYSLPSRAREWLGGAMPTDLLEPPGRRCGCWSTSPVRFSLSRVVVRSFPFGADDGAQAIDADLGFAGSERRPLWR